jgi:hypothetical protein
MNVKINEKLHKEVKDLCKREGLVLKNFCERAIEKELASHKVRERITSKN